MTTETQDQQKTTAGRVERQPVERFVMRPLHWIWEQIKLPVMFVLLFWLSGFGFYHGVMQATEIGRLTVGKALLITIHDLKKTDEGLELD